MAERVGQHGDCGCDHHTGFYDNGFDNGYNYGFDSYGRCTAASYASYARPFAPAACALISSHPDLSRPWLPPTTHTAAALPPPAPAPLPRLHVPSSFRIIGNWLLQLIIT